jgi:hypothetical protein
MKKNIKSIFTTLALSILALPAISQVTSGVVTYDMEMKSDNEQMQMQLDMMSGGKMVMTFDKENFKTEMSNSMMVQKTVFDDSKKSGVMLMEMMGMKTAIPMTEEELTVKNEKEKGNQEKTTYTITDEKKTIAGYECTKVIATSEEGETIMWVTKKIQPKTTKTTFTSDKVDGFPLVIETKSTRGGMPMTVILTATSVKENIKEKEPFNLEVPKGYKTMTVDEYEKMQRQYRGGGGN